MTATPLPALGARRRAPGPLTAGATAAVALWVLSVAVLGVVGLVLTRVILAGRLGRWDEGLNEVLADHRVAWVDRLTSVATGLANTQPVVVLAATFTFVLVVTGHRQHAVRLVLALVVEVTVFLVVNGLVDRPRPDVVRLDSTPSTSSFPSGHVAASLVLWASLALAASPGVRSAVGRALLWIGVGLVTAWVAFARVERGMHHLTDVLGGALLGVMALSVATAVVAIACGAEEARRRAAEDR